MTVKIGVSLGVSPRESIRHSVDVVRHAEEAGFDSAWIADVQLSMKDAFVTLALCATATSRINLGTGVTNPVTRHVTTIANGFSAIQELSAGRAMVGIGSGWTAVYTIGMKPARIADVERSVVDIRELMSGNAVEFEEGKPVELLTAAGRAPVFVAANQPRILEMCGRVADGVILMGGANAEFTSWQIDHVRRGAEQAGRSMDEIELHLWTAISTASDEDTAIDDVRHWVASQAETFSKWRELPPFLRPYIDQFTAASAAYNRLDHMSQHASHKSAVTAELVRYLALVGSYDDSIRRIKELAALGLDGITLAFRAGERMKTMDRISAEIIRPLRNELAES